MMEQPAIKVYETRTLPVSAIRYSAWNPNEQDDRAFNRMVENIRSNGFSVPVAVRPLPDDEINDEERRAGIAYEAVGGEHRHRGAVVLGMTEIPCTVLTDYDRDQAKMQTVALNVQYGKMSATKFVRLYEDLAQRYPAEAIAEMMRFEDQSVLDHLIQSTRRQLSPEMQEALDKSRDEIKTVDDLSTILNRMFSEHGDTLKFNFLVFSFGGRDHYYVTMDARLKKRMDEIAAKCVTEQLDMNEVLTDMLTTSSLTVLNV